MDFKNLEEYQAARSRELASEKPPAPTLPVSIALINPCTGYDHLLGCEVYRVVRTAFEETDAEGRVSLCEPDGIPVRNGRAHRGDFITVANFITPAELRTWVARGCLRRVGTVGFQSSIIPSEVFAEQLWARWFKDHPEPPARDTLSISVRDIRGGVTFALPVAYRVLVPFEDFAQGELVSPSAEGIWQGSHAATASHVRQLVEEGKIRIVARLVDGRGFVPVAEDDFQWEGFEKKRAEEQAFMHDAHFRSSSPDPRF